MLCSRSLVVCASLTVALVGCRSASSWSRATTPAAPLVPHTERAISEAKKSAKRPISETGLESPTVRQAAHSENAALAIDDENAVTPMLDGDELFAGRDELPLDELVAAVKARNPSLQAAYATWSAAANKYPQAIALDDPMFQSMYAPATWNAASNVQGSYYFGVAQKIPWAGKRGLRGNQANWEATAASFDVSEAQLRLAEAARLAFFDYYLNQRERELNAANRDALREFRDVARAKYEANQVTQQDVLQAEVELSQLEQRQIELAQDWTVAAARINTLLHRRPDHPLPSPPKKLTVSEELPPVEGLREWAVEHRPELQAMAARVQAEQTAVALACKEFYPDFEVMGRFDRFWTDREQQPQIGLNMNVPLNQAKRHAAVQEALWRVHKMQADYDQAADNIRSDVQSAYARVQGTRRTVRLYESKILPAARDNVDAARAGYEAGTVDFLRLVEAQRQIIELREKHQMAITEFHRRTAELERAVGDNVQSREFAPQAPAAETPPEPVSDK